MSSLLSSLISSYNAIGQQQHPFESSVANLSSRDRETLAQDVALEINNEEVESSLADLEGTLRESKASLEVFERKERFLGVRIDRYRVLMDKRVRSLMDKLHQTNRNNDDDLTSSYDEDDDDDLENKNSDNMREQLDTLLTDQKSLSSVEELHKEIIMQIEVSRRNIHELEEKQDDIMKKRDECRDFLVVAAEYT